MTCGAIQLPSSTEGSVSFGQYMRSMMAKSAPGAGSQLACLSLSGDQKVLAYLPGCIAAAGSASVAGKQAKAAGAKPGSEFERYGITLCGWVRQRLVWLISTV
jgi:hypothetical protein